MTLETSIQNLADAINNLASTLAANPPLPQNLEATPTSAAVATKRRGRPPKAETVEVIESPEVPAAFAPEPAPVAPPPATAPAIAKSDVQKLLIEVVQKVGRDKCGELCRAHGGPSPPGRGRRTASRLFDLHRLAFRCRGQGSRHLRR